MKELYNLLNQNGIADPSGLMATLDQIQENPETLLSMSDEEQADLENQIDSAIKLFGAAEATNELMSLFSNIR